MANNQRSTMSRKILKLIMVIPAIFSLTGHLFALIKIESASMRRKLMFFLVLAVFSFTLTLSFWLCVNALLLTYLLSINISMVMSCLLLMIFNLLLLVITCLIMALLDIDASFPETRKAIQQLLSD